MSTLINQYTQFLQRNLGISTLEAQAVWVSLAAYIDQRICILKEAYKNFHTVSVPAAAPLIRFHLSRQWCVPFAINSLRRPQ